MLDDDIGLWANVDISLKSASTVKRLDMAQEYRDCIWDPKCDALLVAQHQVLDLTMFV